MWSKWLAPWFDEPRLEKSPWEVSSTVYFLGRPLMSTSDSHCMRRPCTSGHPWLRLGKGWSNNCGPSRHRTTVNSTWKVLGRICPMMSEAPRALVSSKLLKCPRFKSLRCKHVQDTCLNPKAKPRHESINVSPYTQQRDSKYIDFYVECLLQFVRSRATAGDDERSGCPSQPPEPKW